MSDEERVLALIQDERDSVGALSPETGDQRAAIAFHSTLLDLLESNVNDSLETLFCPIAIPHQRTQLNELKFEPALEAPPLWIRYNTFLDMLEEEICAYTELTLIEDEYLGPLGDFRVNQGDPRAGNPCSETVERPSTDALRSSELWLASFGGLGAGEYCADDDRLLAVWQHTDEAILSRSWVYELPVSVALHPLREPPALARVSGLQGIVATFRTTGTSVSLYVIERSPEDDAPGILMLLHSRSLGESELLALAENLLDR